ncbi:hypothetical protein, partial [Klebsiella pneumoniae]|uniref:hypothetical protein n=1 Tax=Klebsiella pneumoniae TaxID=573 RepID=UPI0039E13B60
SFPFFKHQTRERFLQTPVCIPLVGPERFPLIYLMPNASFCGFSNYNGCQAAPFDQSNICRL